jgi:hypothetical protein
VNPFVLQPENEPSGALVAKSSVKICFQPGRSPRGIGTPDGNGGEATTTALMALRCEAEPAAFVAVTSEDTRKPTSAALRT